MPKNKKLFKEIIYSEKQVDARIKELAETIIEHYIGTNPLFICLLRGGAPFSAKLMFAIAKLDPFFHPQLDYMTVRTYGSGRSAKKPEIVMDLSPSTEVKGRPIILLDDILDTGTTSAYVSAQLLVRGAKSVDLCVLVKKQKRNAAFKGVLLHGFVTPPDWQTGMGLDDPRVAIEANRWAQFIAISES